MKRMGYKLLLLAMLISLWAGMARAQDDEYIEDAVDIYELRGKVVAMRDGKPNLTFELTLGEDILWKGARGKIGALLTEKRFLAVSTTSAGWLELALRLHEADGARTAISPYLALLVTRRRAVGFDGLSNHFVENRLPLFEPLVAAEVDYRVAVVVLSGRCAGFALGRSNFAEIPLRVGEDFQALEMKPRLATVRTSQRMLSFQAASNAWSEVSLP
jgi:hypothetical protein